MNPGEREVRLKMNDYQRVHHFGMETYRKARLEEMQFERQQPRTFL